MFDTAVSAVRSYFSSITSASAASVVSSARSACEASAQKVNALACRNDTFLDLVTEVSETDSASYVILSDLYAYSLTEEHEVKWMRNLFDKPGTRMPGSLMTMPANFMPRWLRNFRCLYNLFKEPGTVWTGPYGTVLAEQDKACYLARASHFPLVEPEQVEGPFGIDAIPDEVVIEELQAFSNAWRTGRPLIEELLNQILCYVPHRVCQRSLTIARGTDCRLADTLRHIVVSYNWVLNAIDQDSPETVDQRRQLQLGIAILLTAIDRLAEREPESIPTIIPPPAAIMPATRIYRVMETVAAYGETATEIAHVMILIIPRLIEIGAEAAIRATEPYAKTRMAKIAIRITATAVALAVALFALAIFATLMVDTIGLVPSLVLPTAHLYYVLKRAHQNIPPRPAVDTPVRHISV